MGEKVDWWWFFSYNKLLSENVWRNILLYLANTLQLNYILYRMTSIILGIHFFLIKALCTCRFQIFDDSLQDLWIFVGQAKTV